MRDETEEVLRTPGERGQVGRVVRRWEPEGSRLQLQLSEDAGRTWSDLPLDLVWPWRWLARLGFMEGVWPPESADFLDVHENGALVLEYRAIVGLDVRDGEWPDGVWAARFSPVEKRWALQRLRKQVPPAPGRDAYRGRHGHRS